MKTAIRILLIVLIIKFGYDAIISAFGPKKVSIAEVAVYIPFFVVVVLTIAAFFFDYSFYKTSKNKTQFIPSILACVLYFVVGLKIYQRHCIDQTKAVIVFRKNYNPKSFLQLDLKENNNLVLIDFKFFWKIYYYGKYTPKGDTITLTEIMKNPYLKQTPVTGIIHQNKIYFKGLDTLELVQ